MSVETDSLDIIKAPPARVKETVSRLVVMESLLQSIEVTGQIELVKIIQELLKRFGNDATELVTQLLEKGTVIEKVKINTGTSVKTATPATTINDAKLGKVEKKEKNKKDFDMSRYHRYVSLRYTL